MRNKIKNISKDIEKREAEYLKDAMNLPEACAEDLFKPSLSRRGHRKIISDLKSDLAVWERPRDLWPRKAGQDGR